MNPATATTLFALFLASAAPADGEPPRALVAGAVRSDGGEALAYANVFFADGFEGTMTTSEGKFMLVVKTFGERTLRASYIARHTEEKTFFIHPGDSLYVEFVLGEEPIEIKEIVTTASTYDIGEAEGVSLSSLDVVRTPGAAADVFRALQTFPGLVQVDEGAGLFVRGGDISETLTLLDGATVTYPYRYSSPTGGFFGMFDPFLLEGIHFSSGGFSARYGDALSAVVDLTSHGRPQTGSLSTTVSLAAVSVMGAVPLNRRWGIRFAGNRSHAGLMFDINGGAEDFDRVPESIDGSASLTGRYGRSGQVKLFVFGSGDDIGVDFESPAFDGLYQGKGETHMGNATFSQLFGERVLVAGSLSTTRRQQRSNLGVLDLAIDDTVRKVRVDGSVNTHERLKIHAGGEVERRAADVTGTTPDDDKDFGPGAEFTSFATSYRATRGGAYLEVETRPSRRWLLSIGARGDYHTAIDETVVDPRLSTVLQITEHGGIKLAWGIYHQFPGPQFYDAQAGNPLLGPMRATHYIAGYDYGAGPWRARIEGYYKEYDHLPLDDVELNYTNGGSGYARGVDLFLKGHLGFCEGRVSYSYLRARRKELDKSVPAPPDFDITHTVGVVAQFPMPFGMELSTAYRFATGKPYTPAPGRYNSARVPDYRKWDLAMSKLQSFWPGNFTVFFVSVFNVMDTKNIQDYVYAPDYSERTEVRSYFERSIYFGVSTTLQ